VKDDKKVVFITDDNEKVEFFIIEQTKINGQTYLLASDGIDEETAYILKDISKDIDESAIYEIVEDEDESNLVAKIFEKLIDDVEIQVE
jgi:uncharacterized membrane-anchored protein YitT (DUF2179 family)